MEAKPLPAPVFVLTPRALAQLRRVLQSQQAQNHCLEVHAKPAGCKEMEYALGLVANPGDDQLCWQQEEIRICISLASLRYLLGASLDFVESEEERGFKFSNPSLALTCECTCEATPPKPP